MILGDGTEVRMGNTYGQGGVGDKRGSKEMDRCPLTPNGNGTKAGCLPVPGGHLHLFLSYCNKSLRAFLQMAKRRICQDIDLVWLDIDWIGFGIRHLQMKLSMSDTNIRVQQQTKLTCSIA
jgi:hypothetical protein